FLPPPRFTLFPYMTLFRSMIIHIKNSNGNKDRVVMSSKDLLEELPIYFIKHKPAGYLFEGQTGGMYSAKSVQMIVKNASSKAGIDRKSTRLNSSHVKISYA